MRLGYNEKFHERWQSLVWSTIVHGRRATSLEVARNRLILGYMLFSPDFDIQDRTAMQLDLTKLAFALAAYHADHGSYPAKLDELAPKYVPEIPKDIFADTDLRYKREGDGYLLYSVGVNGKDDGGRGEEDREQQENSADGNAAADWDDLVVRMPAAAEAKEK